MVIIDAFDGPSNSQSHEDPNEDLVGDNSLGQWASYSSSPSVATTLPNTCDLEPVNISREASAGPHDSPVGGPSPDNHLCYTCKKKIRGCVDFKRHLSEHYVQWYCIPSNSVQITESGPICSVCNVPNPDPEHLNRHNALTRCIGSHYSRKRTLIRHLEKYHPKNRNDLDDYSTLAERSRYTGGRKFFACGFCVCGFDSLDRQISHIHETHYHSSTRPPKYSAEKVILGLLSKNECWRDLRAANPSLQDSSFTWNAATVAKLQLKLEKSEESAHDLYEAAFDQCNYGASKDSYAESMPGTSSMTLQMKTNQSMPLLPGPQSWLPQPSSSHKGSTSYSQAPSMTSAGLQPVRMALDQISMDVSDFADVYCGQQVPTESGKTRSPSRPHSHDVKCSTQAQPWPNSAKSAMQPLGAEVRANRTAVSYNSGLAGHFPGASSSPPANKYLMQGAEKSTIPAQAPTRSSESTLENQYSPWTLSPNSPKPQCGQVHNRFRQCRSQNAVFQI